MENKAEKLISLLEDAISLLRFYELNHWADWLSQDVERIRAKDSSGVEHLLSGYGGMGSFTDIFICPENNHKIQKSDVESVNSRLQSLQNEIYLLAKQLKDEI